MNKQIIILVGLPGSGKTTAGDFFRIKKIPVVRMGDVTDRELVRQEMVRNEQNERIVRQELRSRLGLDAYAKESLNEIKNALKNSDYVVVEGLKSPAELTFLRCQGWKTALIYLDAPAVLRYRRLRERPIRPLDHQQAHSRDLYEEKTLGTDRIYFEADYIVSNDSSIEYLKSKLDSILKKITAQNLDVENSP